MRGRRLKTYKVCVICGRLIVQGLYKTVTIKPSQHIKAMSGPAHRKCANGTRQEQR